MSWVNMRSNSLDLRFDALTDEIDYYSYSKVNNNGKLSDHQKKALEEVIELLQPCGERAIKWINRAKRLIATS